jgi:hypothetical protein
MLQPVYRQGESSRKFYIILDGTAIVLKSNDKVVGSQKAVETDAAIEVDSLKSEAKISDEAEPIGYIISSYPTYTHIKTLKSGA